MDFSQSHVWMPHRVSYGETDAMAYCTMQNIYIFLNARGAFTVAHVPARTMKSKKKVSFCRYARPSAGIARRHIMMI